jgi:hypothetical protein
MRLSWATIVIGATSIYVVSCISVTMKRQAAFDSIRMGDAADSVLARFGNPSVREGPEKLFAAYADTKCQAPCAERWWFEGLLPSGWEAWSVSLGIDRKVLEKAHWVFP